MHARLPLPDHEGNEDFERVHHLGGIIIWYVRLRLFESISNEGYLGWKTLCGMPGDPTSSNVAGWWCVGSAYKETRLCSVQSMLSRCIVPVCWVRKLLSQSFFAPETNVLRPKFAAPMIERIENGVPLRASRTKAPLSSSQILPLYV